MRRRADPALKYRAYTPKPSRVPDASMLTGEVSSSLISGNPVLGFLLRAAGRLRSDDLPLTRRLLYQLSYGSITGILHACPVADFPKTSQTKEEKQVGFSGERAIDRIRTGDLRITRALLCQLSYDGETVPA